MLTMDINKLVGLRMRAIRDLRGLTQEQVGKKLGTSGAMYGFYERAESDLKLSTLSKLAGIFNCPPKYFLVSDAEAEAMIFKNGRTEKQPEKVETVPASEVLKQADLSYEKHQLEIKVGKLEAELRAKDKDNDELLEELEKKDAEIAGLRKLLKGAPQPSTDIAKQMLQLSVKLVETVAGSMISESDNASC